MGDVNYVLTCPPNDVEALKHWFQRCKDENCWIQAVFLEGVMGEGNPGEALLPEFYMAARELTLKYDAALCIDSIQAGAQRATCPSVTILVLRTFLARTSKYSRRR